MEVVKQIQYWLDHPALQMVGKDVLDDVGRQGEIVAVAFDKEECYLVQNCGNTRYFLHPDTWKDLKDPITGEKVWKQ